MQRTRPSRHLAALIIGALLASVLAVLAPAVATDAERAQALSGADFDPGQIISDADFYNGSAMSEAEIQRFLENAVGGRCDNSNCLAAYRTDTPTRTWSFGTCSTYHGGAAESAARIIFKVQQACGLSAKVILVTLQKEQSLVTNRAPSDGVMRKAMGYGCPDTSACDSTYYGFFNQIFAAGRQLTWYGNPGGSFTYIRIGQANAIQYHPNAACGTKSVVVKNRATAALYYYTPYTPNAAALANIAGTGDACSAYGNRNFWRFYNEWFPNQVRSDDPFGNFEVGTTTLTTATVRGWAIDPNTKDPIELHLYVNGNWGGAWKADKPRADVGNVHPAFGPNHGFEFTFGVGQGTFEACVFGINVGAGGNKLIGCKTMSTPSGPPVGNFESATLVNRTATVSGWAIDPDTAASIEIHAYVNGGWGGSYRADGARADVGRAYPGYGNAHGFSMPIQVPVGTSEICLFGINQGVGQNQSIGCRTVSNATGAPFGNIEAVTANGSVARVSGWAIDPDTPNPIAIHAYVNGAWGGAYTANASRPDVGAAYNGYGPNHGIAIDVPIPVGTSQVCLFAIDVRGSANPQLGCKAVTRAGGSPFGSLDSATGAPGKVTVWGWAIDPDVKDPISVHVYVDGAWGGAYVADQARADVGRAYPASGDRHGYSATISTPPGQHEVCVFAINVGAGENKLIRCSAVTS